MKPWDCQWSAMCCEFRGPARGESKSWSDTEDKSIASCCERIVEFICVPSSSVFQEHSREWTSQPPNLKLTWIQEKSLLFIAIFFSFFLRGWNQNITWLFFMYIVAGAFFIILCSLWFIWICFMVFALTFAK